MPNQPSAVAREVEQNGFAIRDFRVIRKMSIDDLAKRIPISAPHMRNIENELRSASDVHLNAIADALDVRINSIRRRSVAAREAVA